MTWKPYYQPHEELVRFMDKIWPDAVTFREVTLVPGKSNVVPAEADTRSYFSRNVPLLVPIVSAAMDTVTRGRMARGMAEGGGLGIIDKNLTPKEQAEEVQWAKHGRSALTPEPVTFAPDVTLNYILDEKARRKYEFSSFPIVEGKKLVGLITGHDFEYASDNLSQRVDALMTRDVITGTKGLKPEDAYKLMKERKLKKLPLVDENGDLAGIYDWDQLLKAMKLGPKANVDSNGKLYVGAAIGVYDFERAELLINAGVNVLVIDSAHGHSDNVMNSTEEMKKRMKDEIETVDEIKKQKWPPVDVVSGNISTAEGAKDLLDKGADGIKVGQGGGAICTTRIISGAGIPQVSAVYDACAAVKGEVPICSDGGITYSGDITKGIGAGAQSVMIGTAFAGVDESPSQEVFSKGRRWKRVRGMGSLSAMKESKASRERYNQGDTSLTVHSTKLVPEGVEGLTPHKGKLEDFLFMLVGGLQAGMGYVGAATIEELNLKGHFRKMSAAGVLESHPHDIMITEESPNYQAKSE